MATNFAAGMFAVVSTALAHQPSGSPALLFEVASVKPSKPGFAGVRGGCHGIVSKYSARELASAPPLGRCVITGGRLSHLVYLAWNLRTIGLIKGAADWEIGGAERFTVEAKAEDPTQTTEAQLVQMLQVLIVDRFNLKFHREIKEVAGYALVVAKNGPKLRVAKGEEVVTSFGNGLAKPAGALVVLTARKYSMAVLAKLLSLAGPGPIVDKTGLTGVYDFELTWDEDAGPSIFTALRQQLGLQLEPRKVPESFFVIESAHRPSEN